MLDELIVSNLGIIESAHLEPGPGFVVVTGETGAGKTMLLGALRLLMGANGRRELVGPVEDEAVVDGRFVYESAEHTMRRRVTREGRSKAYIDGSMVPARALQEQASGRIEIVGQHDHMMLTSSSGARQLVDGALTAVGKKAKAACEEAWHQLVVVRQKIELLGGGRRELERELEIVRFQADEIAAAGFGEGDEQDLSTRAARLRNAEDLADGFNAVMAALGEDGASHGLGAAIDEIARLSRLDPGLHQITDRLRELADGLGEIQVEIAGTAAELEHEPGELDLIETRIAELGRLKRKYGETLDEILDFGTEATRRAGELTELLGTADELATELADAEAQATVTAEALSKARRKAAKVIASSAVAHLRELGMSSPVVSFEFDRVELGPNGLDRIELAFASDETLHPGPASKIASGGELSRLTLALRLAAGIEDADLVAFDEVDAGIGGATALAMGEKLSALAKERQLFCVTHLPQVAAFADSHYVVLRSGSRATVELVTGDDRLAEVSRMLGGLADSERGQLHAAELLQAARQD